MGEAPAAPPLSGNDEPQVSDVVTDSTLGSAFQRAEALSSSSSSPQDVAAAAAASLYREAAASEGSSGKDKGAALFALAELHRLGRDTGAAGKAWDASQVRALYHASADAGNASAQFAMSVLHASGLYGAPRDDARAVLYAHFAALGGHSGAQMAMGFRHAQGLGVQKNCSIGVQYYELAANRVADELANSHLPRPPYKHRLADWAFSSSGGAAGVGSGADTEETLVQYYHYLSDSGHDPRMLAALGDLYYTGGRGVPRDLAAAAAMYRKAAESQSARAHGALGHMHIHGLGVERDYDAAFRHFNESYFLGGGIGLNGMGT